MKKGRRMLGIILSGAMAVYGLWGCGIADAGAKKAADAGAEGSGRAEDREKKMKLGITLYSLKNEYTVRLANAAQTKAEELGAELVVYDGNYDPSTQISQVETMISDGCDGIILNPQDSDACSPCVDKAADAGIPIVAVNTRVNNDRITGYIGSQDVIAGEMIMQKIADTLGGRGKIVIIQGPMGQSAQIERREGIQNILDQYPGLEVLAEKTANWSRSESMTVMETWLQAFDRIDAIVAENDEMALGAREAVKAAGKDIPAVGVDGINDALTAVEEGNLMITVFQDAAGQGSRAVQVVMDAIEKKPVEKNYWIDFEEVNKNNVAEFKQRAQQ